MTNHYWWACSEDRMLRYGDNRVAADGVTHTVAPDRVVVGKFGLHACCNPSDAIELGHGPIVYSVALGGKVVDDPHTPLLAASERTYIYGFDARGILLQWAQDTFDNLAYPRKLVDYDVHKYAEKCLFMAHGNRHGSWQKFRYAVSQVAWGSCRATSMVLDMGDFHGKLRKVREDLNRRFIQEVRDHG